jgi:hypothetical protein
MKDLDIYDSLDDAMRNSYEVIVNNTDPINLITEGVIVFAHDIKSNVDNEIIDIIIEYFEEIEEYEICNQLKNKQNEI